MITNEIVGKGTITCASSAGLFLMVINIDRLDLQELGVVYEILNGGEVDRCHGIVEKTMKLSERVQ